MTTSADGGKKEMKMNKGFALRRRKKGPKALRAYCREMTRRGPQERRIMRVLVPVPGKGETKAMVELQKKLDYFSAKGPKLTIKELLERIRGLEQ